MQIKLPLRSACIGGVGIDGVQQVEELDSGSLYPSPIHTPRQRSRSRNSSMSRAASPRTTPSLQPTDSFESTSDDEDAMFCPQEALAYTEAQMAIVITCMNESTRTIKGVLSGVPRNCLIILVSNSNRQWQVSSTDGQDPDTESEDEAGIEKPMVVDRYLKEVKLVRKFCRRTKRHAITVHQQDPGLAEAIATAGMPQLVEEVTSAGSNETTKRIRSGKGEAMIVGMAIAALTRKKYIGFVDGDNYVPGTVTEYCQVFAAGLYAASEAGGHRHAMVRITWNSKPKIHDNQIKFDKKGRSSVVVNEWLNRLLADYETPQTPIVGTPDVGKHFPSSPAMSATSSSSLADLIVTGNAGEHAMTMDLGLDLRLAGGYAIEPYELINILEQFGPLSPFASPSSSPRPESLPSPRPGSSSSNTSIARTPFKIDTRMAPGASSPPSISTTPVRRSPSPDSRFSPKAPSARLLSPTSAVSPRPIPFPTHRNTNSTFLRLPSPSPSAYSTSTNSSLSSMPSLPRFPSPTFSSPANTSAAAAAAVRVLQIRTRNPHFHDSSKGSSHIRHMQRQALSVLYHSTLATEELRKELRDFMKSQGLLTDQNEKKEVESLEGKGEECEPEKERIYPPVRTLNFAVLYDMLLSTKTTTTTTVDNEVEERITFAAASFRQCGIYQSRGEALVYHPDDDEDEYPTEGEDSEEDMLFGGNGGVYGLGVGLEGL